MKRTVRVALGPEAEVADVLTQLRQTLHPRTAIRLEVALLPRLVQIRHVPLPRMTEEEARKVIGRNVSRYFPDVRDTQAVAVVRTRAAWLVAIAPEQVISAIHSVAETFGWEVGSIVPAHVPWSRSARDGLIAVLGSHETTVLESRRGRISSVRRLRPEAPFPSELASARIVAEGDDQAARLATRNQRFVSLLDLVPESVRAARVRIARRTASWLTGASAALLLLAGGLVLFGERRELNAVREHRASIRADVQGALTSRDTLLHLSERLATIAALERNSERWSAVIARVAEALPFDASLTAFRAEADSVTLEGQASDAGGVFAAMRAAPGLTAVRASAPVRQEVGGTGGEAVIERFTMAAQVGRPDRRP